MYTFSFDLSTPTAVLFGIALALSIIFIFIYLRPISKVGTAIRSHAGVSPAEGVAVPVSVIVYATDQADSLRHLLPVLLGQNYNAPFEVIVVNEGESDATVEVVERLRLIHDNLYLTYTPDGARQLSRKKLALTIGIKAAHHPVVVQTTASAVIDSDDWLAHMTAPFADKSTEVVIGLSHLDHNNDRGIGKAMRTFNSSADDTTWIWSALSGRPYRGSELNLAYTRESFFNNRGFSRSLNLKNGDDDIFISEIARPHNTAVVLNPVAMVTRHNRNIAKAYSNLRDRYYFTGRNISHLWRRIFAAGTWLLWIIIALCAAAAIILWPNLLGLTVAAVFVIGLLVAVTIVWRKTVYALSGRKLLFSIPVLTLCRPFANTVAKIKSTAHRRHNYTWIK